VKVIGRRDIQAQRLLCDCCCLMLDHCQSMSLAGIDHSDWSLHRHLQQCTINYIIMMLLSKQIHVSYSRIDYCIMPCTLFTSHLLFHLPPAHHSHPPSHIHCFIPGSKLTCYTNLFHYSLLAPTWTAFSDYTGPDLLWSTVFHF